MKALEYAGINQGGPFICLGVYVKFGTDRSRDGMRRDFAKAVLRQNMATGEDLHGTPSLVELRSLVPARSDTTGELTSVAGGASVGEGANSNVELA